MKIETMTNSISEGLTITQWGLISTSQLQPETHHPPALGEVTICREWFSRHVVPAEQMDARTVYHASPTTLTSYAAKHLVETWTEQQYGIRQHISQGAFIQAALDLGYAIQPVTESGHIKKSVQIHVWLREDDWRRVWPAGFSRWLFRFRDDNSPIGDLARDAFADPQWPRRADDFVVFHAHLRRNHVKLYVFDVLDEAWELYANSSD